MQEISAKMSIKLDSLGIVQEIEIWPYEHVVDAQPQICPGEWDAQSCLEFWDKNISFNLGQTTRPSDSKEKQINK